MAMQMSRNRASYKCRKSWKICTFAFFSQIDLSISSHTVSISSSYSRFIFLLQHLSSNFKIQERQQCSVDRTTSVILMDSKIPSLKPSTTMWYKIKKNNNKDFQSQRNCRMKPPRSCRIAICPKTCRRLRRLTTICIVRSRVAAAVMSTGITRRSPSMHNTRSKGIKTCTTTQ